MTHPIRRDTFRRTDDRTVEHVRTEVRELREQLSARQAEIEILQRQHEIQIMRMAQMQAELDDIRRVRNESRIPPLTAPHTRTVAT